MFYRYGKTETIINILSFPVTLCPQFVAGQPKGTRTINRYSFVQGVAAELELELSSEIEVRNASILAGEPGFEPGLHGPEPCVLPLDDSPAHYNCSY